MTSEMFALIDNNHVTSSARIVRGQLHRSYVCNSPEFRESHHQNQWIWRLIGRTQNLTKSSTCHRLVLDLAFFLFFFFFFVFAWDFVANCES